MVIEIEKGLLQVGFVPHWNCFLGFQDFADWDPFQP